MNDKIAKEIAKELRLIRIELQKINKPLEPQKITIDGHDVANMVVDNIEKQERAKQIFAGERVTIK